MKYMILVIMMVAASLGIKWHQNIISNQDVDLS